MIKTVYIIEDDKDLIVYLKKILNEENFSVKVLTDGATTLEEIRNSKPDLILLDLMLPRIQGESLCKDIKDEYPDLPVIVLTGKTGLKDKINVFELGADDYLTKPFAPEELLLRIKARLKENKPTSKKLTAGDLEMDLNSLTVSRSGKTISLTPQEFKLLECLISNKGIVLSRETLLNKIWPNSLDIETRVVDVYISYLRKKIDKGFDKDIISSVRGFGYTIRDSD